MIKANTDFAAFNDPAITNAYPNSNVLLYRESMNDGSIEYTLVLRTKGTNMTTHRSDVRVKPNDFAAFSRAALVFDLLKNMKEL